MAWDGVRWRLRGVRQHIAVAWRDIGHPGRALATLVRAPLRPTTNAPWRLRRYGQAVLRETVAAADEVGAPVFVTFGTLLGWVREGDFIRHDDDIDLGLLERHWPLAQELAERMAAEGWDVTWFGDDEVRFACRRLGDVAIDVFRFREDGDHLESRAYSDGMRTVHRYRFPERLVVPLVPRPVHDVDVRVPADAEAFLAHHYGEDWRTPVASWDYRTEAASEV